MSSPPSGADAPPSGSPAGTPPRDRNARWTGARPSRAAFAGLLLLATLAAGGCWIEEAENAELEETSTGPGLEARVRQMLDSSAAGWNRGDLDAFMAAYKESSQTTYVGGSGLRRGHDAIRQRYAPRFGSGAERDSLRFEDLQVRKLDDGLAVGVARWVLHREGRTTGSGPFTLVLERTSDGWKIVHDHSSSSDTDAPEEGAARPEEPVG